MDRDLGGDRAVLVASIVCAVLALIVVYLYP